ncbi:MAG: hypothetical protein ABSG68_19260 [Thermoguttaceae bacterium]|jgi:anti-sigma factor RsiW
MSNEPGNDEIQLREELVAYLDGELDAEASRRIEQRLADEPEIRLLVQGLDRTWQLLDKLDAPPPDVSFTHSTLAMVAVAAEAEQPGALGGPNPRRLRRGLLLGGGLLAAALAGFLLVTAAAPDPNRQLLQDLPLLENLDQYRQVDSLKFLRMLGDENLFAEDVDDAQ